MRGARIVPWTATHDLRDAARGARFARESMQLRGGEAVQRGRCGGYGSLALAVQAGFAYFDSTRLRWLDDAVGDATVMVVPVEAFASFLIVHGRWLVLQRVAGNAAAILYPDAFTTVRVNGDASASDFSVRDAYSVVPSLLMSLGAFNLRLGVGYGNYNVPLVNFVLPKRTLIPELDLYLLF